MAGNSGGNNNRNGGASISAAATAVGSAETRFPQQERVFSYLIPFLLNVRRLITLIYVLNYLIIVDCDLHFGKIIIVNAHLFWQRRGWGGCWGGLSCFGTQKGGKRIVPASRIPEGNTSANRANGPQPVGLTNQVTTLTPSLLAPPSSPASFTNSALPSTAQSPSCFLSLSANSPGGPSSTMFATGPYAHETQLVSPPVFSTFTTEPSTAPLTPPPELAHLTTPSSPDVPFAQFLSSSMDLRSAEKSGYVAVNDLQATYPLYPGSPASSLISPISGTSGGGLSSSFPDRQFPAQWGASISAPDSQYPSSGSSKFFGTDTTTSKNFMLSQDPSFFCPATSAQFYLDQAQQSYPSYAHCGGRLSLSRDADVYSNGGNGHQNRNNKNCKPDVEEIEAYRASFGFSADEIIATPHYVEICDVLEDSFTMMPFASSKPHVEENKSMAPELTNGGKKTQTILLDYKGLKLASDHVSGGRDRDAAWDSCNGCKDQDLHKVFWRCLCIQTVEKNCPRILFNSIAEIPLWPFADLDLAFPPTLTCSSSLWNKAGISASCPSTDSPRNFPIPPVLSNTHRDTASGPAGMDNDLGSSNSSHSTIVGGVEKPISCLMSNSGRRDSRISGSTLESCLFT
ncbi:hypothetical protein HHK36_010530 [Tetracentron sinense]|uniref:Uncharacterized protein n=1 Tax=Tetracentron sinense TaxID=13715 RepID=A0A834ZI72_TETSI|nr:hypothetical protein HHK36_010530 [Tetracentron sinense]